MDEERYWSMITQAESNGKEFIDICKDYMMFELNAFDTMWKYIFFHDFAKSRQKHGVAKACGILLLFCILRGIGKVVLWHESFWSGFLYPAVLFLLGSAVMLPLYILSKKAPKAAQVIAMVIIILGTGIFVFCGLFIIYGIIRSIFG